MTKLANGPNRSELLIYQTDDGKMRLQVLLENETVWLTQKMMAELFQKDIWTINEHIRNIFDEGELEADSVIRKFRITAEDGKRYETNHYNLDVIISVGYRVKSHRGTQFRILATQRLHEYIIKGFTLDDASNRLEADCKRVLDEPSPVERHSIEAVKEMKKLEKGRKPRTTRKGEKNE
jgi:hypothetical protein